MSISIGTGVGLTFGNQQGGGGAQPPAAPVFVVDPVIFIVGGGTPTTDAVAECDGGTVSGHPTPLISYQWKLDGTNAGTDSATYTIQAADIGKTLTCVVTAMNTEDTANATSNGLDVEGALSAPVIGTPASIVGGTTTGSVLTVTDGTATGNPTPTVGGRQWYRDAAPISGETGLQYTMLESDNGQEITCVVTWTNGVTPDAASISNAIEGTGSSYTPSLDFSDNRNSQYLGMI